MNKEKILKVVAKLTRKIASTANSSVSTYYVYQPEVPKKLKK
ncbi:cyclic lactone autoinducer peptide [Clostridium swellfunianum]|nr:cyclic lactone autoinducer peptide [Clostridium swellfunianum]MCM0647731.1 cyclic lactone autoinducer peptide [Clostridium swellfunianum]